MMSTDYYSFFYLGMILMRTKVMAEHLPPTTQPKADRRA
jgi:hypothetical protein